MKKNGRNRYRLTGAVLALMTAAASVAPGFIMTARAEENITGPSGTGYAKSRWEKLTDNTLEYDEVGDRVHEFNTTISQTWDTLQDKQADLLGHIEDLENREHEIEILRDRAHDEKKKAEKSGNLEDYVDAATDEATHKAQLDGFSYGGTTVPGFSGILESLKSSAESMLISRSTVNQIKKGENQITMVAQQLLITYDSLEKQKAVLDVMAELYGEQYQIALTQQQLGMATENDVYAAQVDQLSAASLSASIQSGMSQLKPTICTLNGYAADADITIASVPEMDLSLLDSMNLEEDTKKAIGNNSELQSQRTSEKGKTMDGVAARLGYISEGEQKMAIKMQSLSDDVAAKRTAWEAAKDGYEAALKEKDMYAQMYELGSLSRVQYLGTQISACQAESEYQSACTALRLAYETYQWAVMGLVNAD